MKENVRSRRTDLHRQTGQCYIGEKMEQKQNMLHGINVKSARHRLNGDGGTRGVTWNSKEHGYLSHMKSVSAFELDDGKKENNNRTH